VYPLLRLKLMYGGYRRGPSGLIGPISLVLCLWCAFPHALLAQTNTDVIPLSAYQEKLLAWQAVLAQSDDAAQAATIQQEVAAIRQVELPTGAVVTLHPLLGDPDAGAIDIAMARTYLATAINELAAAANDDTAARLLLLTQIFQRAEFVERDSLWQRFWRWLRSWLPTVEPTESSAAPMAPLFQWLGWALIGIGAVLLIWLLSYWLQSLLASFIGGVERSQTTENQSLPQSVAEARANAHQLANAGSYRNAVRHLYLSALLALHERNRITYQQSDTNREVLTAVRNQPQLHQQLQPVIETFDDVWYGVHEPDRTSFDSYVAAVEKLEEVQ
jgi:hypothetical protein